MYFSIILICVTLILMHIPLSPSTTNTFLLYLDLAAYAADIPPEPPPMIIKSYAIADISIYTCMYIYIYIYMDTYMYMHECYVHACMLYALM